MQLIPCTTVLYGQRIMKIYWITKCTTNGYSFPLFSYLLKKEGRREGEWISKTSFKQGFFRDQFNLHQKKNIKKAVHLVTRCYILMGSRSHYFMPHPFKVMHVNCSLTFQWLLKKNFFMLIALLFSLFCQQWNTTTK